MKMGVYSVIRSAKTVKYEQRFEKGRPAFPKVPIQYIGELMTSLLTTAKLSFTGFTDYNNLRPISVQCYNIIYRAHYPCTLKP